MERLIGIRSVCIPITVIALLVIPAARVTEATGGGANGRDILHVPISWCVVAGSPAEANPNILGQDGILDDTTDAILWRRHERPTCNVFLPQADISLRSAINDSWGELSFPIITDPDLAVGLPGDVSGWDVNFDGAEFNKLNNLCDAAYEAIGRAGVGITAVNINLFHDGGRPQADGDLDGSPDGDTVMDYYPIIGWAGCTHYAGTTECAEPYDGRLMVPDNFYFYPTVPDRTFPPSPHDPAGDLEYSITDSLDLITGHEVGQALGLLPRNDPMALMNRRPVDNVGGDNDVDNIELNSAEITALRSNALIVPGLEIDPPGQFDPGNFIGQRLVDLGIEPGVSSYLNLASVNVVLQRVGTSIYFNQYLFGLLPTDGGELSYAILTDLDMDSDTGCTAADLAGLGVDDNFPGAEMVAVVTLSDMTIISSAAYECAADGTITQIDPDVFDFSILVLSLYPLVSPFNNQSTVPQGFAADVHNTINLRFENLSLPRPIAIGVPFRLQAVTMQDGAFRDDLDGRRFQLEEPSFPHCFPQSDVPPGGTVAVAYDGLVPNTEIHVLLGPHLVLDGVLTDANGEGTAQMPIPADASEGLHLVTIGHDGLALTADCTVNVVVPCGQSEFPTCGGECPPDETCGPDATGGGCVCAPIECGDSEAPECGGVCPAFSQCQEVIGAELCSCRACDTVVPAGDITMQWFSGTQFRWNGLECADRYNVYRSRQARFADVDGNNLADDYGSCFLPDLMVTQASDALEPAAGVFFGYLVTGENVVGEGDLSTNSFGVTRPNDAPCP